MKGYVYRLPEISDCDLCCQCSMKEPDCKHCIIREKFNTEREPEKDISLYLIDDENPWNE